MEIKDIFYINLHLKSRINISQFAKASLCQRERWHHLPYL